MKKNLKRGLLSDSSKSINVYWSTAEIEQYISLFGRSPFDKVEPEKQLYTLANYNRQK